MPIGSRTNILASDTRSSIATYSRSASSSRSTLIALSTILIPTLVVVGSNDEDNNVLLPIGNDTTTLKRY
jgi:hypothetical protein